ncbi:hypothetical protein ACH5RR_017484 [Cinchona calisaya]|uniref:F-box domain-containing protein n=1 Tax=Cinchona calisaya TaxID=153742 RepID=A0ABD2ZIP5_9GENT
MERLRNDTCSLSIPPPPATSNTSFQPFVAISETFTQMEMASSIATTVPSKMPNLPWEIIVDILSRLPATSLLRFRCVSKPWCSFIDSPDFIKIHLSQSKKTSSNLSLILGFLGIYSIDFDSLDCARVLKPAFSTSDVSNSCNGLVLLMGPNQTPFLWNPSTRKYKTLPDSPLKYPDDGDASSFSLYKRYGFGYVAQEDDYKVFRVVEFRGPDSIWVGSEAKIYSLKSNSWKMVEDYPYSLPRIKWWGVHVNGVLHKVLCISNSEKEIVAFDLRSEENYTVPKPDFSPVEYVDLSVSAMAGCLCLVGFRKNRRRTDIWIMKEYGVKKSWSKLLSIAALDGEPYSIVSPLAYSKRGDEVLLNCDDEKLVWYDLRRKTTREVNVRGLPFRLYAEVFIGSLIPLENGGLSRCVSGGVDEIEIRRRAGRQEKRKGKDTWRKKYNLTGV